ncbi:hypothetical protein ACFQ08_37985, partial [Streptosporangium algeriense]
VKHAAAFKAGATVIADAVPLLPAELGTQVAAVFGGEVAEPEKPEPFVPATLPAVEKPGPFPAPSLGGERHFHGDWVECEQWLAAFVKQAWDDRTALRAQLKPAFDGSFPYLYETERWLDLSYWIAALAKEVIAPGSDPGVPDPEPVDPWAGSSFSVRVSAVPADEEEPEEEEEEDQEDDEPTEPVRAFDNLPEHVREEIFRQMAELGASEERVASMRDGLPLPPRDQAEPRFRVGISYMGSRPLFGKVEPPDPSVEYRRRNRLPGPRNVSEPHMFLLHRFSELYVALREGALPPVLLATPTSMTGHLAPDVLVERLEACAA